MQEFHPHYLTLNGIHDRASFRPPKTTTVLLQQAHDCIEISRVQGLHALQALAPSPKSKFTAVS